MNQNAFRNSGGVSVFVSNELSNLITVTRIFNHYENCIVLLFKFSELCNYKDVVMYFTYVSPEGSPIYHERDEQNGICILQENIDEIQLSHPDCNILICGDLNARTKYFLDLIPSDNLDYIFGDVDYPASRFEIPRNNKDSQRSNLFGRTLVHFCSSHDMYICNGRLFDDFEGNFTCFVNGGTSVVDYIIASENMFQFFTAFLVDEIDESDHLPVTCRLTFEPLNDPSNDHTHDLPNTVYPRYKWQEDKRNSFIDRFKQSLNEKCQNIYLHINDDLNVAVQMITEMYHHAAQHMKINIYLRNKTSMTDPEWWDEECETLKEKKNRNLRKFRSSNSESDLLNYKTAKTLFKNKCQEKRSCLQKQKRYSLVQARNNPKLLWNMLKAGRQNNCVNPNIATQDWFDYFKSLLFVNDQDQIDTTSVPIGNDNDLNHEISHDEILNSITSLKIGKSSGVDGIGAEFYITTVVEITPIMFKLFNQIFNSGIFPSSWGESIITPIYKSGLQNDPNNYRGISVTTTLYKIFSRIINNRLYNWAEENHKIDEAQAGFRRGYSVTDNIFTLQAMIQKYLSKRGGRFYCLFVDFKKAFDKINHAKLFECLENRGIHGKMLRILKSMYSNLRSCVKTPEGATPLFPCNTGTRQGDVTSTTIFIIFINELCTLLRENCTSGIFINNDIPDILCLLLADDVTSCAETVVRLQQQLNLIDIFCRDTGMELNLNKTEIIVFRNGGNLRQNEKWYFRGNLVKITSVYKYLGLLFTPGLSWATAQQKLAAQAYKSYFSILQYQKPYGRFSSKEYFYLFDAMVKPILCYGAQIWGHTYSSIVESVQNNICKRHLCLSKNINNDVALGECGRLPLCVSYFTICIKYWCK